MPSESCAASALHKTLARSALVDEVSEPTINTPRVSEYWRFDATGGDFYGEPLVGERLVDGDYRPFDLRHDGDGRTWSHSEALNLDVWWEDGQLRFWDPVTTTWLLSHEEDHTGRLEAEAEVRRLRAQLEGPGEER